MRTIIFRFWLIAIFICIAPAINAKTIYAEIDGYYYDLSDSTASIRCKYSGSNDYWGNVIIPETVSYEGKQYTVTSIKGEAFYECAALISVSIPKTITKIGHHAFWHCTALTSISIPGSVLSIGESIFKECENLREVVFCDGEEPLEMWSYQFYNSLFEDSKVNKIYLGRNISEENIIDPHMAFSEKAHGLFTSSYLNTILFGDKVRKIVYCAFAGCENLESVVIPDGISAIGIGAFSDCTNLSSLEISNPQCQIGDYSFWRCSALTSLNINAPSIGNYAFSKCNSLTTVSINSSAIGNYAFEDCKKLTEITLGKNLSVIHNWAFRNCDNLKILYCFPLNPPSINLDGFYQNQVFTTGDHNDPYHYNVDLYVPEASVSNYMAIEPWKDFKQVIGIHVPIETISFDIHELEMNINTSQSISYTVLPEDASNKKIDWISSDNEIVSVKDGIITANGEGEAYVYAISQESPNISDSCLINVVIPVTGISLSHNEYTLGIGNSIQLETVIIPYNATNKAIHWSSSNEDVCKVDNGLVSALCKGSAIITATTENGGYTASCLFTIIQPVTGIALNYEEITLTRIGETFTLEATVLPEDASNKEIQWSSSNESICMVSKGKVIATGYGTGVVLALTVDGGFLASCIVTVEDTSAIQDIRDIHENDRTVDYMGREIKHTQKGHLYIRNGEKYIAK